ncbi:isocitrate lyase/PEP mutase family protein [Paenibacillus sp. 1P07SE]|uniref:isocitrate lyase/PEP mutase family protein n=1 Tax=Paenibacillus sp. 1P07SE TaxID=3132209 RepID=UPI0039A6B710
MRPDEQVVLYNLFKQLHYTGKPLVLPNAWDPMSAKLLQQCGFPALGTTSAGIAASLGRPDGERVGVEEMIAAVGRIAAAVDIPVTADLEAGYSCTPETIGELARKAAAAGVAGLNIEDGAGGAALGLLDAGEQARRIHAIQAAAADVGLPLFINARIDTYWHRIGEEKERLSATLDRAEIYRHAGADGIFVPGVSDLETITILAGQLALPLNVLASPELPDLAALAAAGVARVSTGSGLYRAAMTGLRDMGMTLFRQGDYASILQRAMRYDEMQLLLEGRRGQGEQKS